MTEEQWVDILYAGVQGAGWVAAVFIVAFVCVSSFILLNLFIAVILENFEMKEEEKKEKQRQQLEKYLEAHRQTVGDGEPKPTTISSIFRRIFQRISSFFHRARRERRSQYRRHTIAANSDVRPISTASQQRLLMRRASAAPSAWGSYTRLTSPTMSPTLQPSEVTHIEMPVIRRMKHSMVCDHVIPTF